MAVTTDTAENMTQKELEELFQADDPADGGWEITKGGDSDEELTPVWDFEADKILMGTYSRKKSGVGSNKSNLYEFNTPKGVFAVWGSYVIDDYMTDIPLGYLVRIEFLGKQMNKKTKRYFKNYTLNAKPAPIKK